MWQFPSVFRQFSPPPSCVPQGDLPPAPSDDNPSPAGSSAASGVCWPARPAGLAGLCVLARLPPVMMAASGRISANQGVMP